MPSTSARRRLPRSEAPPRYLDAPISPPVTRVRVPSATPTTTPARTRRRASFYLVEGPHQAGSVEIQGRRILVTGASSGIGHALALELASRGARLVVTARSVDKLEELAAATDAEVFPADLSICGRRPIWPLASARSTSSSTMLAPDCRTRRDDRRRRAGPRRLRTQLLEPARADRCADATGDRQRHLAGAGHPVAAVGRIRRRQSRTIGRHRDVADGAARHPCHRGRPRSSRYPGAGRSTSDPGSARVLDKLPTGSAERLARRIATAIERDRTRVVFPDLLPCARSAHHRPSNPASPGTQRSNRRHGVPDGLAGDAASIAARASWRPRR